MFILYAVVVGLLVGFLVGGRPAGLAALRLRWVPAIALGFLAQVVLFSEPVAERVGALGPGLYVGTTLVVVAAVVRNLAVRGMPLVAAGAASNLAAVAANGGFMPASPSALAAAGRSVSEAYSNSSLASDPALWPLTDVFALPGWLPLANVFSVGDVLIGIGIAVVIVLAMRRRGAALAGSAAAIPAAGETGAARVP